MAEDEDSLLRAIALQNAQSILAARRRAEQELLEAKEALALKAADLYQQREWFRVTLSSIGDAVITTDIRGRITFLNPLAEALTGWKFTEAAGKPMAETAVSQGLNPLFQNNVTYVVLLWGGLTTNFIWCMLLNARNNTYGDYSNSKAPLSKNYFFSALAGTTWFLQFFFYGMGESKLGNGASSWILHMAFIILIANVWGILLKEWKGVSNKTRTTITIGISMIILSVLVVGYGNSIK